MLAYQDVFLVSYASRDGDDGAHETEVIKIVDKGLDQESITRFVLDISPVISIGSPIKSSLLAKSVQDGASESERQSRPFPVFDESR